MNISVYYQTEKNLELFEKLIEIEKLRRAGISDLDSHSVSERLRKSIKEKSYA